MEPVQTSVKNNKRGLGADKVKKKLKETTDMAASDTKNQVKHLLYEVLCKFVITIVDFLGVV